MEKKHNRPGRMMKKKDEALNGIITKDKNRYTIYQNGMKNSQ